MATLSCKEDWKTPDLWTQHPPPKEQKPFIRKRCWWHSQKTDKTWGLLVREKDAGSVMKGLVLLPLNNCNKKESLLLFWKRKTHLADKFVNSLTKCQSSKFLKVNESPSIWYQPVYQFTKTKRKKTFPPQLLWLKSAKTSFIG